MGRGRGNLTPKDIEAMKIISNNINLLLLKTDTKQVDLSRTTGIPASTITGYVKGTSLPIPGNIQKIADFFHVKKSDIDPRFKEEKQTTIAPPQYITSIPLYGNICCGSGIFVDDEIMDTITLPAEFLQKKDTYFAQYAKGDSMINANIEEGDLLIFDKTSVLDNGQIGCFCIDDNNAVCKRYYHNNSNIILQPENENYLPIVIDFMENTHFRIIGKLIRVLKKKP